MGRCRTPDRARADRRQHGEAGSHGHPRLAHHRAAAAAMIRLILAVLLFAPAALACPAGTGGIMYDQRQGSSLPLDAQFVEADGKPVFLRDLIRGPTILLLG